MADKKKASATKKSDANVVRIKATDDTPARTKKAKKSEVAETTVVKTKATSKKPVVAASAAPKATAKSTKKATAEPKAKKLRTPTAKGLARPFAAIGGYFKGAWYELTQVRWPNRRATWSLTAAVLVYSALFVAIILGLDAGFKFIFDELILGN